MKIIDAEAADGSIRGLVVEMRGCHLGYFAPRNQLWRSDVRPIFPAVESDPEQTIVCAGPDRVFIFEGRGKRVNHSALRLGLFVFRGQISQTCGDARFFAREIGANGLPGLSAIRRLE